MWCRVPRLTKWETCHFPSSLPPWSLPALQQGGGALASTALLHFEATVRPRPRHVGLERASEAARPREKMGTRQKRPPLAEVAAEAKTAATNERCVGEGGEA